MGVEAEGRLLHKDWEYYDAIHVVFRPKHMTPYQLQELVLLEKRSDGHIETVRELPVAFVPLTRASEGL